MSIELMKKILRLQQQATEDSLALLETEDVEVTDEEIEAEEKVVEPLEEPAVFEGSDEVPAVTESDNGKDVKEESVDDEAETAENAVESTANNGDEPVENKHDYDEDLDVVEKYLEDFPPNDEQRVITECELFEDGLLARGEALDEKGESTTDPSDFKAMKAGDRIKFYTEEVLVNFVDDGMEIVGCQDTQTDGFDILNRYTHSALNNRLCPHYI